MPDYKRMYLHLFNAQSEVLVAICNIQKILLQSHQDTEEMAMDAPEDNTLQFGQRGDKQDD
jgi:hypothetical protein